ncbi:MAG: transglutaminase family protein [Leptolyngbyaceae cyanobacterium bins.59]|nr:transglutaminase family protein [Leptolyngbyaceae cyanobacterium bins.59]
MMTQHSTVLSQTQPSWLQTIRPIGAYKLQSLVAWGDSLLTIDSLNGYLLQVKPGSDNTTILNPHHTEEFTDATGLAVSDNTLWISRGDAVYRYVGFTGEPLPVEAKAELFTTLPYAIDGITIWKSTLYVASQKWGYIKVCNTEIDKEITRFRSPGIGPENLTVRNEELWVCDQLEQTVYCLDRATGEVQFSVLTPFACPTGLAFYPDPDRAATLYVTYAEEEAYVRDNPNIDPPYELAYRDRTLIHPLYFYHNPEERYALSNGYLIEISYVEELSPLDEMEIKDVEWRIALPSETPRQKIRSVEAIGVPFTEEIQDGQRVAVFKFPSLNSQERHLFGWKALLEVWSIKYLIKPRDVEKSPELPTDFERYLVDNDELAMDLPVIRQAAREAIGTETNLLRKMLKIRNYVYDRLSYSIKPHIDTPDVALERGTGSCGEYLGLLLALSRLNGIACRTVGRYKCPKFPDRPFVIQEPEFNHVWLEFYAPGYGWLPMESNPDDIIDNGPYPTRFFMGLSWYHTEIGKGISFQKLKFADQENQGVSIGDLSLNHIRYKILEELRPDGHTTPV